MIIGIGNDIIEIDRVRKACEKKTFLTRCFSAREIECFKDKPLSLAGNYAVKEAVVKAFGTGFSGINPNEIEVLRNEAGAPYVVLYGNALEMYNKLGVKHIYVTISNLKSIASGVVILEG